MEGSADKVAIDAICMYDRANSPLSLSSMCDYLESAGHAQAVIKELKHCPQLERLT